MERVNIRVSEAEGVVGSDVPLLIIGDAARGPTVSVMAGVHGAEYVAMRALQQFLDQVDESRLQGCLRVVPIANLASFHARSAFVTPHDGKNLNRCFPGDPRGSFSDRLAAALFENVIQPSAFHVDMHSGDLVEDLVPFALYDESPVSEKAREMAHAYGLDYVIRVERSESPIAGTSSAAAAQVGVPAITAEVGGRGLVDRESVQRHLTGLRRVLAHLGVLAAEPSSATPSKEVGQWSWLRSPVAGWWECDVRVGEEVAAGSRLGTVRPLGGGDYVDITAPTRGTPLFVTTSPAVTDDGLLLGFGVL